MIDNWSEDEIYEAFLDVMFSEFTRDEMEYAHHVQSEALARELIEGDGHS